MAIAVRSVVVTACLVSVVCMVGGCGDPYYNQPQQHYTQQTTLAQQNTQPTPDPLTSPAAHALFGMLGAGAYNSATNTAQQNAALQGLGQGGLAYQQNEAIRNAGTQNSATQSPASPTPASLAAAKLVQMGYQITVEPISITDDKGKVWKGDVPMLVLDGAKCLVLSEEDGVYGLVDLSVPKGLKRFERLQPLSGGDNLKNTVAAHQGIRNVTDDKMTEGQTYTGPEVQDSNGAWVAHGRGTMTWPSGDKYIGEFKYGKVDGRGVLTKPTGGSYDGEWKDNKKEGHGVLNFPDGDKYDGEFRNDHYSGHGVFTTRAGNKYDGEWKNGIPDGQGTVTMPDGGKYVGDLRGNKRHGQGKMTYPDGKVEDGVWQDDKFTGGQSQPSPGAGTQNAGSSSKTGLVSITADDDTFEVSIDGSFVGNTPAKLKLSEGSHVIEVKKAGYKDYRREITVTDGAELNIRAVLEKN